MCVFGGGDCTGKSWAFTHFNVNKGSEWGNKVDGGGENLGLFQSPIQKSFMAKGREGIADWTLGGVKLFLLPQISFLSSIRFVRKQ